MNRRGFLLAMLSTFAATASLRKSVRAEALEARAPVASPRQADLGGPGRLLGPNGSPDADVLTPAQSRAFRAWMVRIIGVQLAAGPTPRWQHRDCAGLVRFAAAEALREHDDRWKRANGLAGQPVPPELALSAAQQSLRHRWRLADGNTSAYVNAIELVQENARFRAKDCNLAQPGDLLFFDQGDAQHLMVWMGHFIAYHTGSPTREDNGLRAVALRDLLAWSDTRWQPSEANPNFAGVYRLAFLTA